MILPVDLDDGPGGWAVEIDDIAAQGMLATES
jgi:hypothetical protein